MSDQVDEHLFPSKHRDTRHHSRTFSSSHQEDVAARHWIRRRQQEIIQPTNLQRTSIPPQFCPPQGVLLTAKPNEDMATRTSISSGLYTYTDGPSGLRNEEEGKPRCSVFCYANPAVEKPCTTCSWVCCAIVFFLAVSSSIRLGSLAQAYLVQTARMYKNGTMEGGCC